MAETLPNYDSRQGKQTDKRTTLKDLNAGICSLFQKLMLYMEEGFDESRRAAMRQVAGGDYYLAAARDNWKAAKTMQEMAITFMADYAADLVKGDCRIILR